MVLLGLKGGDWSPAVGASGPGKPTPCGDLQLVCASSTVCGSGRRAGGDVSRRASCSCDRTSGWFGLAAASPDGSDSGLCQVCLFIVHIKTVNVKVIMEKHIPVASPDALSSNAVAYV